MRNGLSHDELQKLAHQVRRDGPGPAMPQEARPEVLGHGDKPMLQVRIEVLEDMVDRAMPLPHRVENVLYRLRGVPPSSDAEVAFDTGGDEVRHQCALDRLEMLTSRLGRILNDAEAKLNELDDVT